VPHAHWLPWVRPSRGVQSPLPLQMKPGGRLSSIERLLQGWCRPPQVRDPMASGSATGAGAALGSRQWRGQDTPVGQYAAPSRRVPRCRGQTHLGLHLMSALSSSMASISATFHVTKCHTPDADLTTERRLVRNGTALDALVETEAATVAGSAELGRPTSKRGLTTRAARGLAGVGWSTSQ